jgi:hypothetical protein
MENTTMIENANKLAYLKKLYPELETDELLKLMQVSGAEKNAAIWLGQELGFLSTDVSKNEIELGTPPEVWQFGKDVEILQQVIHYCFEQLAKRETDLDEHFLTDWLAGYPPQNSLVAVGQLVEDRVLFEYELTDDNPKTGKSVYKFYTLFENSEMQWGKKNFKKAPKAEGEK